MKFHSSLSFYILSCTISSVAALALPNSSSSSSPSSTSTNNKQIINLQSQHAIISPSERMMKIASNCQGISEFDQYGDFEKNPTTSFLKRFEKEVSDVFGKEDAVFMPSGTMAQSIALLIHSRRSSNSSEHYQEDKKDEEAIHHNHGDVIGGDHDGKEATPMEKKIHKNRNPRFACHHSCHLLLWEEHGYKELLQMDAVEINTKMQYKEQKDESRCLLHVPPMRYQDVYECFIKEKEKEEELTKNIGEDGLSTLIIELPHRELGGKTTPWVDIVDMSNLCKEEGVKFHCDGARIFEASAGYGLSLLEMATVFDSVYISFYKGLGAITGAMLMGDKAFCDEARIWLQRFGGNLYTLLPYAVDSWDAFQNNVLDGNIKKFQNRLDKIRSLVKGIQSCTDGVDDFVVFDPPVPETNMVHVYLKASLNKCELARDFVKEVYGVEVFSRLREIDTSNPLSDLGYGAYFEWTIGDGNGSIDNDVYLFSWKVFVEKLQDLITNHVD